MDRSEMGKAARALIIFAVVSFVTALVFNITTGTVKGEIPASGGLIGPIVVESDRTVYQVYVAQRVARDGAWNQVTAAVLDQEKNPLFSFGEEFWRESGYDDGGSWTEQKSDYDMKMTLQAGTYFIEFESENNDPGLGQILVEVKKKGGSAVPFFIGGILALILGIILNEMAKGTIKKAIDKSSSGSDVWG